MCEGERGADDISGSSHWQMVNLFENTSPSEWLLYISEWTYNNSATSNIRSSTKLAVHCLLAKDSELQEYGTAFIHNVAGKDVKTVVFDDVAVELAMAVLQFLNSKPSEEHLFRSMKALSRFVNVRGMTGWWMNSWAGTNGRLFVCFRCLRISRSLCR